MKKYQRKRPCPCGLSNDYMHCCGIYHQAKGAPLLAQTLMRARYSAYVLGEIRFIRDTMMPPASKGFSTRSAKIWAKSLTWHGLEVIETWKGQAGDQVGVVEFIAHYSDKQGKHTQQEISLFHRTASGWLYSDALPNRSAIEQY